MTSEPFIGRKKELDFLAKELSAKSLGQNPVVFFYICGDEGIGKKTFISKYWETAQKEETAYLWIRPKNLNIATNPYDLCTRIADSLEANDTKRYNVIEEFQNEMDNTIAMAVDYDATTNQVTENQPKDFSESDEQTKQTEVENLGNMLANLLSKSLYSSSLIDIDGLPVRWVKTLIVIDDYDLLSDEQRFWIEQMLFKPLNLFKDQTDLRLIISGSEEQKKVIPLSKHLTRLSNQSESIDIPPFSLQETVQYLEECKLPVVHAETLLKKTRGIPALIRDQAQKIQATAQLAQHEDWIGKILEGKTEEQKQWLSWASVLHDCTPETLSIFSGREESDNVYEWLMADPLLFFDQEGQRLRLSRDEANALELWFRENDGDRYQKEKERAESFLDIADLIPLAEDRHMLALLSVFKFFNTKIIFSTFDSEQAKAIQAFVDKKRKYFAETEANQYIAPEYQKTVAQYCDLVHFSHPQKLKDRVAELWNEDRKNLLKEIKEIEKNMKEKEQILDGVSKDLNKIKANINSVNMTIRKNKQTPKTKSPINTATRSSKNKRYLKAFALEAGGIILLYFSILFSDTFSLSYCIFGLAMILAGIFSPIKAQSNQSSQNIKSASVESNAPSIEHLNKSLRVLFLKKTTLENRHNTLLLKVSEYKQGMKRLDNVLHESYS